MYRERVCVEIEVTDSREVEGVGGRAESGTDGSVV